MEDYLTYEEILDYMNRISTGSKGDHDYYEDEESNGIPEFHRGDAYELMNVDIASIPDTEAPDLDLVKDYAEKAAGGSPLPPVVLSKLNNEIMDGRHRIAAAKMLGYKYIKAYVPSKR
jgi:hypothetical protein